LIPYLNIRTSPITLYLRHPKQLLAAAHRRLLDWEKQTSWLGMVLGWTVQSREIIEGYVSIEAGDIYINQSNA
jgi:hypothetical protein